jgi:hypothetical protein
MKTINGLYKVLIAISAITVLSGLTQLIKPDFVLGVISGEATPTSMHFFAIVGMFMVLFGGAMLHALLSKKNHPVVVLWAALQKWGAFLAVGLGVLRHIFSPVALLVAGFDLLSGILIFLYWISIKE